MPSALPGAPQLLLVERALASCLSVCPSSTLGTLRHAHLRVRAHKSPFVLVACAVSPCP